MVTSPDIDIQIRIPGYPRLRNAQFITRLEGNGNYTIVHLDNGEKPLLVICTLKWFERKLPSFIRISKSALINPYYVSGITKRTAKMIYLRLLDGNLQAVSRRRTLETIGRLVSYFGPSFN